MKKTIGKYSRQQFETIVSELNYNLTRIDKTLSTIHVVKQFAENELAKPSLIPDAIHGIAFLLLDTMCELESLRDNINFYLGDD